MQLEREREKSKTGDQRHGLLEGEEAETYPDSHLQESVPEQHASLTGMEMICKVAAQRVY